MLIGSIGLALPGTAHAGVGFVRADRPMHPLFEVYTPVAAHQHNSSGRTNTVVRLSPSTGSVPTCSYIPPEPQTHNARSPAEPAGDLWESRLATGHEVAGTDVAASVACFNVADAPVDSQFFVTSLTGGP